MPWLPIRDWVSIHAPTWGATGRPTINQRTPRFQSTRPRGARPASTFKIIVEIVSIHAPTWGATQRYYLPTSFLGFNPRAHVGRDSIAQQRVTPCAVSIHAPTWGATVMRFGSWCCKGFQSTRPRGARLHSEDVAYDQASFNPRAHVGRDLRCTISFRCNNVSIHAPTWGATCNWLNVLPLLCFNPRAHVGRDLIFCALICFL